MIFSMLFQNSEECYFKFDGKCQKMKRRPEIHCSKWNKVMLNMKLIVNLKQQYKVEIGRTVGYIEFV